MQNNFCFVDTETDTIQLNETTKSLVFKLACSIFWNKELNQKIEKTYYNPSDFWSDVEQCFSDTYRQLIIFAHNMQFDFKILDTHKQLLLRDWYVDFDSFYSKGKVFIISYKKGKYTLYLWSTTNYVGETLENLGKSIGLEKLKVDFNTVNSSDLEIYCKRDTEIIYQFIKQLIEFLEQHDLSKLKPTAGSLSFNIFRHNFYNPETDKDYIIIHDWKKAIKLERESYHGGITDCFKIGEYKDVYKLDINSMYPDIMKNNKVPIRLLCYYHETNHSQKELRQLYNRCKSKYGIIARVTVNIPKQNAYILSDYGLGKTSFAYGKNITLSLCSPELQFIEQNGGHIVQIHEINVYYMKNIFKDFVDFFYNLKVQYKQQNNLVQEKFCKLVLNSQYGKWGQREIRKELIEKDTEYFKKNYDMLLHILQYNLSKSENNKNKDNLTGFYYLGVIKNHYRLYILNNRLYRIKQTTENSKESFVAIASFITSYARMELIKYLKQAKRENIYYCDTDSLFTNEQGYQNLTPYIHETKLGYLKIEGKDICNIFAPKYYTFAGDLKAKGIRKNAKLLYETYQKRVYEQELWVQFETSLKYGYIDQQVIKTIIKEANKYYDKGHVIDNTVYPFSIQEIQLLSAKT